jgi:hypothetical protein
MRKIYILMDTGYDRFVYGVFSSEKEAEIAAKKLLRSNYDVNEIELDQFYPNGTDWNTL